MKKFGKLWWVEVIGVFGLGILALVMHTNGANSSDVIALVFLEILLIVDIVYSLFKTNDNNSEI